MNVPVRGAVSRLRCPAGWVLACAGALVVAAGLLVGAVPSAASAAPARAPAAANAAMEPACPPAGPHFARCLTLYRPQAGVNRAIARGAPADPAGWSPQELQSAYRLPASDNPYQTVAVSIAYDTPRLEQYLAAYRAQYGLPACTIANGCFRQVNQKGQASPLPDSGVGSGWDLEATLDVSMISAACPLCHILVVEADTAAIADLASTDTTAVRLGAAVVSNSYGTREDGYALAYRNSYHHPGHVIVAAAGDLGFTAANFPADLATVTAAGGTRLAWAAGPRGWSERAWNDDAGAGGSGCSAYVAKPSWQHDPDCAMRTVADVSAVAANISIYNEDYGGWITVEGTSISAPFIAGVYGLAGNAATITPGHPYAHPAALFDVTAGTNDWFFGTGGTACGHDYLCVATRGYDGPTGLGTPDGTGAF